MTTTDPEAPADTRLMRIIHEALRRDLRRTREALTATPAPDQRRRRAIARHLGWMMQFLHAHHAGEDDGLYPMVRDRDPAAARLLDEMHADHESIAPRIAAVEAAAEGYGHDDGAGRRADLLAAVEQLEEVLLPHLRREEDEAMPLVSAAITDGELRRWDEEANIKPKSLPELAQEGHWILDGLGPEDRDHVVHLVGPLERFILVRGFARSYRRRRDACWGPATPERTRLQHHGRVTVVVDADPGAVWEVARDVTRVGEWSHECVGAEWRGGATEAVPGARFRGRNRQGIFRWGRVCEVVDVGDREVAWRTVPTLLYPDSSEWRIRVEEAAGGARIEQSFRVLKAPRVLEAFYATVIPAHRDRTEALAGDLRRLGAVAAARPTNPGDEAGVVSRTGQESVA